MFVRSCDSTIFNETNLWFVLFCVYERARLKVFMHACPYLEKKFCVYLHTVCSNSSEGFELCALLRLECSARVSNRQWAEEGRLQVCLPGEHLWLRSLLLIEVRGGMRDGGQAGKHLCPILPSSVPSNRAVSLYQLHSLPKSKWKKNL